MQYNPQPPHIRGPLGAYRDTLRSNQHHGVRLSEGAERVVAGIGGGLDCNELDQVGKYLAMTDGGLSS